MSNTFDPSLHQAVRQNNSVQDESERSRQRYDQVDAYLSCFEPAGQQFSGCNMVTRRRIQNRDAARRYRSKRANSGNKELSQPNGTHKKQRSPTIGEIESQSQHFQKIVPHPSEEFPVHKPSVQESSAYTDSASSHDENTLLSPPRSAGASSVRLNGSSRGSPSQFDDPLMEETLLSQLDSVLPELNKLQSSIGTYDAVSWPKLSYSGSQTFISKDNATSASFSNKECRSVPEYYHHSQFPAPSRQNTEITTSFTQSYFNDPAGSYATPQSERASLKNDGSDHDDDDDDEYHQTSLHIATKCGHESMVDMLLKSGIAIDHPDSEGNTPLHIAVIGRKLTIIQRLLVFGADPNTTNIAGWTPVHLAIQAGSVDAVQMLVGHGGDLGKKAGRKF